MEERKEKTRTLANAIKRKKNRCKISYKKQFNYGQKVAAPDMPDDVYKVASEEFMSNLKAFVSDRKGIQQRTILQRESSEWAQITYDNCTVLYCRLLMIKFEAVIIWGLMITASNFGAVVKR